MAAELKGIETALEHGLTSPIAREKINIFTYSLSALQALQKIPPADNIQIMNRIITLIQALKNLNGKNHQHPFIHPITLHTQISHNYHLMKEHPSTIQFLLHMSTHSLINHTHTICPKTTHLHVKHNIQSSPLQVPPLHIIHLQVSPLHIMHLPISQPKLHILLLPLPMSLRHNLKNNHYTHTQSQNLPLSPPVKPHTHPINHHIQRHTPILHNHTKPHHRHHANNLTQPLIKF